MNRRSSRTSKPAPNEPVYADHNATTPLSDAAKAAVVRGMELWGNPSSAHPLGRAAKEALEEARSQIAHSIGASPEDVVLTSGGTEASNQILRSAVELFGDAQPGRTAHVLTTAIEHDATLRCLEDLERRGLVEVSRVRPDPSSGAVRVGDVEAALRPTTALVSVMLANNETGVLQPVPDIARVLKPLGVKLHTDAAQALGKMRVDVAELGVDYATLAGHKFYGPRVGALFARGLGSPEGGGRVLRPILFGGGQERRYRPGTENVAMGLGLGAAAEEAARLQPEDAVRMARLRDDLEAQLIDALGKERCQVNFASSPRLANTSSVAFPLLKGSSRALLEACAQDFTASTGAACHSASERPSAVLRESGVGPAAALRTLRLSLGRHSSEADVHRIVAALLRHLPPLEH